MRLPGGLGGLKDMKVDSKFMLQVIDTEINTYMLSSYQSNANRGSFLPSSWF
jgi:hypothetical protein